MQKHLLTSDGHGRGVRASSSPTWRAVAFVLLSLWLGLSNPVAAQVDTYTFTARQDAFTPLTSATAIAGMSADSYLSASLPLGFTFVFDGTPYTSVKASSDGYLTFGTATTTSLTNAPATTAAANRPLIAPLWDDLDGRPTGATGTGSYLVSGTSPNRVFTFEWLNWEWNYAATGPVISFQAKLYEGTNKIEFFYQAESAPISSGSASIGLVGSGTGAGSYLTLDNPTAAPTVSSTTATTTISTKPATGQVYTFVPAPLAACPAPRNLAANPSATSADVTWTVAGGGGSFRIEYGLQGFVLGQGQQITSTTPTATIPGLTPVTQYQFYVTQLCGGGNGSSTTTGPVSFTTRAVAPANDDCANAVTLTPGAIAAACTSATSGTVEAATGTTLAAPVGTADDDVWYKFTATSSSHTVTLTGTGDYVQQVLSGSCATLTSVNYSDPNVRTYTGLTTGTLYYVRVYSYSATAPTSAAAAFTICVTTAAPTVTPANDECSTATVLPVPRGTSCVTSLVATNVGATGSLGPADPTCSSYAGGDVWYVLTVPANGIVVLETDSVGASPVTDTGLTVYSGSCSGTLTQVGCDDDSSPNGFFSLLTLTGRTPGEQLYVRVFEYGNDAFGRFKVCAHTPSPCPEPTALTATALTGTTATLGWSTPGGAGTFTVEYGPSGFVPGTGTVIPGVTGTSLPVTGLAPTTAYQFYVTQVCGGSTGSSTPVGPLSFSTTPVNDNPSGAIALTLVGECTTPQAGTNGSASTTAPVGYANPGTGCGTTTTPRDVWFTFRTLATGRGSAEATLTVSGAAASLVRVFSAPSAAGPFTQVGCTASPTAGTTSPALTLTNLTPASTYYVMVANARTDDPQGAFTICLTAPSDCPVPAGLTTLSTTATSATVSWAVNASTPSGTFELEYGRTGFALGTGTRVTGLTSTTYTLTGLSADTEYCYYVRQNCGATSGSSTFTGPACVRTALAPATNDEPANAIAIPVTGVVLPATSLGATTTVPNGYVNPGCTTANNPKDVWFTLTPPAGTAPLTLTTTGTPAGQVRVFTAASAAGPFTQVACRASAGNNQTVGSFTLGGLTAGTRYFVSVAGYGSNDVTGPFTLQAQFVTAVRAELPGGSVSVYPNPSTTGQLTLLVLGAGQVTAAQAVLLNGLGQVVRTQAVPVQGGAAEAALAVRGLAHGVYTLRLQIGEHTITRKVVLE